MHLFKIFAMLILHLFEIFYYANIHLFEIFDKSFVKEFNFKLRNLIVFGLIRRFNMDIKLIFILEVS